MMPDYSVLSNTSYKTNRTYYTPLVIGWHQLLMPNPSRWSIWLRELGPGPAIFSPVRDIAFPSLFASSGVSPELKMYLGHYPNLVSSAWYVYYDTLPTGAGCEAYETTPVGT